MIDRLIDLRGYGTVEKCVTTNPNISAGAKGFYGYLCSFAGNKDNAYPGTDLICHHMSIAKGTLQKYIKELKENNVIQVTQERTQGKFSHNIYTLLPFTEIQKTVHDNTVDQKTVHQKLDSKNNSFKKNSINNNSVYTNIYEFYLSLGLIEHKSLTEAMKKAMKKAIKENSYTEEDMKELLKVHKNAVEATRGTNYPVKVRTLQEFFGQKIQGATALICTQYEEGGKYYKYKDKQLKRMNKQERIINVLEDMF